MNLHPRKKKRLILKWVVVPSIFGMFGYCVIGPRISKELVVPQKQGALRSALIVNQSETEVEPIPAKPLLKTYSMSKPRFKFRPKVQILVDNEGKAPAPHPVHYSQPTDLGLPLEMEQAKKPTRTPKKRTPPRLEERTESPPPPRPEYTPPPPPVEKVGEQRDDDVYDEDEDIEV